MFLFFLLPLLKYLWNNDKICKNMQTKIVSEPTAVMKHLYIIHIVL